MSAGLLWNTLFSGNELNIRKGLFGSVLVRDYNLSATSLTGFNPFADDGNLVTNLFDSDNVGGAWIDLGYLDEKGPEFDPKMTAQLTKVYQSRRPARADYTDDAEEINFTLMESTPTVELLIQNKALANIPALGEANFAVGRPLELDTVYRQLLVIMVDGSQGKNYYKVRLYPRVLLTKIGKISSNAKKPFDYQLTWESFPDPYTVSPDGIAGSPVITFEDGPAWRAQGNAISWPSPQTPPVAVVGSSAGNATLTFAAPTGSPTGYSVYQTTGDVTSVAAATSVTATGTVTSSITGLTTGDDYTFFVVAEGSTGNSLPSETSNSITAP